MASTKPPRKFNVTPVEETTKSSHQPPKSRRFAPQPVEETVISSKDKREASAAAQAQEKPKPRRFAPQPVEETVRSSKEAHPQPSSEQEKAKPRRFAPEPVETSTKSSKSKPEVTSEQAAKPKPKPRRFAPQLVDETEKSSKDTKPVDSKPHVKFTPEVVSTSYGSNRRGKRHNGTATPDAADQEQEQPAPRKFEPILIDTARRSRRAGDPNAPLDQDYRTEYGYHAHAREHWKRVTGQVTPAASEIAADSSDDEESTASSTTGRRRSCNLDGSSTRQVRDLKPARTHSFRLPELDTIESSESEPDSVPSSPRSMNEESSPITASPDSSYHLFEHATRRRESIDDDFQHYLLDIERKKAQQRLEEQALAAFPNADFGYEPPHHYFNTDDDSDVEIEDRPTTFEDFEDDLMDMARRESTVRFNHEHYEMQQHAEFMQQERNVMKPMNKRDSEAGWAKPKSVSETGPAEAEMKSMRDRARPPMLGADLVFPRCPSPDAARFDVTQGSAALRNQMCYLTETAENERKRSGEDGGLWQAQKPVNKRISTAKSPAAETKKSPTSAKGLWGGFCVNDGEDAVSPSGVRTPTVKATGLQTPKPENNPFELAFSEGRPVGLMTPGTPSKKLKESDLNRLNAVLVTERDFDAMMEREYPDAFVTQVYNYLSLGYPSLARPFDEELSKISRFSVAELRQDDEKAKATPRGYIRLGSDFEGGGGEGLTEDSCMRWQALKRYVREWARQEKNMVKADGLGGFGAGARRGSWAN